MHMSGEWLDRLEDELSRRFSGKSYDQVVFVGVGNRFRGDDGIGPVLIDLLKDRLPNTVDAGYAPENYTSTIKRLKPAVIVFVDAVKFDGCPAGFARLLDMREIEQRRISVHNLSLDTIMGYLKEETGADVFMIGVQPKVVTDEEGLSPGMAAALKEIADAILHSMSVK